MTDLYTLEDGSGVLLLENLDRYQQDIPLKNISDTVGVTETENRVKGKTILEVVGITEASNIATGFVKVATQAIIGLTDVFNKKISEFEYLIELNGTDAYELEDGTGIYLQDYPLKVQNTTVGVTETNQKILGFLKNLASTVGITDTVNHVTGFVKVATDFIVAVEEVLNTLLEEINFYLLEDSSGKYINEDGTGGRFIIEALIIVRNITTTVGLVEASQKIPGLIKHIATTVGLVEGIIRTRIMLRNITTSTVGVTETSNRLGTWIRNVSSTVGLTEANNRARVMFRNFSSTIGITEASEKIKTLIQNITSTVGITEVNNLITGIVLNIAETIGLTESLNRIRSVFIDFDIGNFIGNAASNFGNFIAMAGKDNEDTTVIDSYNVGDVNLKDTN